MVKIRTFRFWCIKYWVLNRKIRGFIRKNVIYFNTDFKTTTNTGHVLIALDIESFMPFEEFINEIDNVWNIMKSSRKMEGYSNIRLPGENRHFIFEKNTKEGIELNEDTINKLNQVAKSLDVPILN